MTLSVDPPAASEALGRVGTGLPLKPGSAGEHERGRSMQTGHRELRRRPGSDAASSSAA
jgi:hypothetical protein